MIEIPESLFLFMLIMSIWGCINIIHNLFQWIRIGDGADGEA